MKSNHIMSLVLVVTLISIMLAANAVQALDVTATLPVGKGPSGLAYDSAKGEVFVCNGQDNTVSVISDSTNAVIATINVGTYPYGAAYDPAKGEVFIVNLNSNNVSVISDVSNTVVATVEVGTSPYNCAYDPSTGEIYVTNSGAGTVSVISDSTNAVVSNIAVGVEPFGVVYDSGKGEIFVANMANVGGNTIFVISDSNHSVIATVPVPSCQFLTYDSGKGEIFLGDYNSKSVSVISDSTNSVIATIVLSTDAGTVPVSGLAYDPERNEIFVALHQDSLVKVISDSGNQVVQSITVNGGPWAVAYDSGKSAIYVTNGFSNQVTVISDAGNASPSASSPSSGGADWVIIIIIVIILILLLLLWYFRRRKLTVTVQDSRTQAPIPNATVNAQGPENLSGVTERNGRAVFNGLKDGDYQVMASASGYYPSDPLTVSVMKKNECIVKLNPVASPTQGGPAGQGAPERSNVGPGNGPVSAAPAVEPSPDQVTEPNAMQATSPSDDQTDEEGPRVQKIIEKFREKGALSPETAKTADELGLSRMFVRIVERRKGRAKVFVEINGRYYLDEKALQERKAR